MNKERINSVRLFGTAFLQVCFVSINTVMLATGNVIGMAFASFLISIIWTHNVKKAVFASEFDRIMYALGATAGCLFGYFFTTQL